MRADKALTAVASLNLTLIALILLGLGVVVAYVNEAGKTWPMVLPLLLLALNLLSAIVTRPVFRRQLPLLVFHLALLALIALVAAGRLSYLKGWVKLIDGESFAGQLGELDAGPLHRNRLADISFSNAGFSIEYQSGMRRGPTQNRVRVRDSNGIERERVIGDQDPLVLDGYRFYTSSNKGFAPIFLWQPKGGEPQLGSLMLPSYPINDFNQSIEWTPPGSTTVVWVALELDAPVVDPERASTFRLPKRHRLILRFGDVRHELVPGAAVELAEGRLVYQGLRTWMGYQVFHDWTIPWMLAACFIAVASLAAHFWRKFASRPWLAEE